MKLGALLRIPADLSDPVLSVGADGYPAGVTHEYYAFVNLNLKKIPVVLDEPPGAAHGAPRPARYWQGLLGRSRSQSAVIRTELFQRGRVIDHRTVDYRTPVFGVASLSYSRAVTAIAATWLAVWRDVRGDVTRMSAPATVRPREPAPGRAVATPSPGRALPGGPKPMSARRAILSVYRKDGIVELARGLAARGFEIVSTGGTAEELRRAEVKVVGISDVTKLPGDPGRPREDAAPGHPRRHPGPARPAGARGVAARSTASRPSRWWW